MSNALYLTLAVTFIMPVCLDENFYWFWIVSAGIILFVGFRKLRLDCNFDSGTITIRKTFLGYYYRRVRVIQFEDIVKVRCSQKFSPNHKTTSQFRCQLLFVEKSNRLTRVKRLDPTGAAEIFREIVKWMEMHGHLEPLNLNPETRRAIFKTMNLDLRTHTHSGPSSPGPIAASTHAHSF